MRVTRIVVTDPNDKRLPVRDVIELWDHSDVATLIKECEPRWKGWKISVEFAIVSYGGSYDHRDADVGVNGGRGW